jgi:Spy/CpxP family protein refolding chaperone
MRTSLMTGGLLALVAFLPLAGRAQTGGPTPSPGILAPHHETSGSEIPGLGADEIAELLEGRGMGQARVAEVQGYPGPRHVLDLWGAGTLPLSSEQATQVQEIARAMASEARRVGGLVLDTERELARAFRSGGIDTESLRARVERIAALRGELRTVHLRAHLETRAVLDPAQIARYAELRGHAPDGGTPRHGH